MIAYARRDRVHVRLAPPNPEDVIEVAEELVSARSNPDLNSDDRWAGQAAAESEGAAEYEWDEVFTESLPIAAAEGLSLKLSAAIIQAKVYAGHFNRGDEA